MPYKPKKGCSEVICTSREESLTLHDWMTAFRFVDEHIVKYFETWGCTDLHAGNPVPEVEASDACGTLKHACQNREQVTRSRHIMLNRFSNLISQGHSPKEPSPDVIHHERGRLYAALIEFTSILLVFWGGCYSVGS